jgi:hypothetical protein
MNYKEIVDLIKNTCEEHYFINQVGYGNLSDLNTPEDEEPPLYPYAFLNPVSISQSNNTGSLSLNLIIMTQTYENETSELTEQSNCVRYINDVISHINMNLVNPDVEFVTPFTITPFKERFSDDVVGATANITINFSSLFNDCDSAFLRPPNSFSITGFTFDGGGIDDREFNGTWRRIDTNLVVDANLSTYLCYEDATILTYKQDGTDNLIISASMTTPIAILAKPIIPYDGCNSTYGGLNVGLFVNVTIGSGSVNWNRYNGQYFLKEGTYNIYNAQQDIVTIKYID